MDQLPVGVDPHGGPGSGPPPGQSRCAVHDLAAGPDGRCVVCRREETPERSESHLVWIVLTAVLALGVGPATFYFFYWRHRDKPTRQSSAKTAQRGMERPSDDPEGDDLARLERLSRQADARRRARVARDRATSGAATPQPLGRTGISRRSTAVERANAAAQARRKAADAQRARAQSAKAMRQQEQAARGQANLRAAIKQVSITAYMADW